MPEFFKQLLDMDVYRAALDRVAYAYDFGEHVVLSFSGGKDSTVLLFLCQEVAESLGFPKPYLHVAYFDEEIVDPDTTAFVEQVKGYDWLTFHHFCVPVRHSIKSSSRAYWRTWDPEEQARWVKQPAAGAVTREVFGAGFDWQDARYDSIVRTYFGGLLNNNFISLLAIRANESLTRRKSIAQAQTWLFGAKERVPAVRMGKPIYDWGDQDVWRYIKERNLPYSVHYDHLAQAGVALRNQRISTWGNAYFAGAGHLMRELYPDLWNKAILRLPELETMMRYGHSTFYSRSNHKPAGMTWREYALTVLNMLDDDSRKVWQSIIVARLRNWHGRSSGPFPEIKTHVSENSWQHLVEGMTQNELANGRPRDTF